MCDVKATYSGSGYSFALLGWFWAWLTLARRCRGWAKAVGIVYTFFVLGFFLGDMRCTRYQLRVFETMQL